MQWNYMDSAQFGLHILLESHHEKGEYIQRLYLSEFDKGHP